MDTGENGREIHILKKMVRLVAMLMLLATLLCGCGKFTCDFCGEEKSGSKHTVEFLGEKIDICKDCKKGLDELGNMFG